MSSQYSVEQIPQSLDQILQDIQQGKSIQILQNGQQVAVILSNQEYARLCQPPSDFWAALEKFREEHDIANADIDPDEIFANVRVAHQALD
jgi:antitoxin (DNA-binding transcriptional repressor) of toxin-antitoxin stability system